MLIVLGMATIFGAIKGFAWQVASLASIIVSYVVAYRFRFDVAEMIQAKPPWNQFLAMLILYVGTSFVIWVGFRLLSTSIDRVAAERIDRHLGAAFGLAKGLVYCLLITMFATSLLGPKQQAAICHSRSGYYIAKAARQRMGILPSEIHDVVGPYLARLDEQTQKRWRLRWLLWMTTRTATALPTTRFGPAVGFRDSKDFRPACKTKSKTVFRTRFKMEFATPCRSFSLGSVRRIRTCRA
ncbi:MAG: CvpA family protein [Pirellulaceae bacterium]